MFLNVSPIYSIGIPTKYDYTVGYYKRYIVQYVNNRKKFVEVDSVQVSLLLNNSLYNIIECKWYISGKKEIVEDYNKRIVNSLNMKYKGIKYLLQSNYMLHYKSE